MRNYIIYYIAALAESIVAFIQNSLKIRSPKLERRLEPLNRQTPQSYTPQQNLCAKVYQYDLYWPLPPYEHCFVEIGCKLDIIKGTYKAGVSYAVAYQVNNSLSSFNTIPTHIPLHSLFRARFRSWDRHTTNSINTKPCHRSVDRPTPSRHCLKARSP